MKLKIISIVSVFIMLLSACITGEGELYPAVAPVADAVPMVQNPSVGATPIETLAPLPTVQGFETPGPYMVPSVTAESTIAPLTQVGEIYNLVTPTVEATTTPYTEPIAFLDRASEEGEETETPAIKKVRQHYKDKTKQAGVIEADGTPRPINVLYFDNATETEQLQIAADFIQAAKEDDRCVQIEIGFGIQPFSVFDAAGNKDCVVLGFDFNLSPYYFQNERGLPVNFPETGTQGLALTFKADAYGLLDPDILPTRLPKVDIAYSIAPYNNTTAEMAILTAQLAEIGYVIPAPEYTPIDAVTLQNRVNDESATTAVSVIPMYIDQFQSILGTNHSMFLYRDRPLYNLYDVIVSQQK